MPGPRRLGTTRRKSETASGIDGDPSIGTPTGGVERVVLSNTGFPSPAAAAPGRGTASVWRCRRSAYCPEPGVARRVLAGTESAPADRPTSLAARREASPVRPRRWSLPRRPAMVLNLGMDLAGSVFRFRAPIHCIVPPAAGPRRRRRPIRTKMPLPFFAANGEFVAKRGAPKLVRGAGRRERREPAGEKRWPRRPDLPRANPPRSYCASRRSIAPRAFFHHEVTVTPSTRGDLRNASPTIP